MKNIVIINGYPQSTIVTLPSLHHHNQFLPLRKPPFLFISLHNPFFNSLSKPISLTPSPSPNCTQTKLQVPCNGSNFIEDGSSNSNFDGFLGSKVVVLSGDVLRLLFMEFLQALAGFKFSIENLTKPSDTVETSIDKHSSRLALRKEVHNDSRRVGDRGSNAVDIFDRRRVLLSSVGSIAFCFLNTAPFSAAPLALAASSRADYADMPALRGKDYGKTKMRYPDYTETETGLQFKDLRIGTGPTPKIGDTVVIDWDGYTIGYYGRIFEARNKTKGGSFEGDDKAFFKFRLGAQEVIPAFEEAIVGMSLGGVRRVIVPPELGYPGNDYNQKGPRPTTFSGQRALNFVLRNQGLIDKTLLFDIELLKIIPN